MYSRAYANHYIDLRRSIEHFFQRNSQLFLNSPEDVIEAKHRLFMRVNAYV
jgi:hypothetical protein